MKRILLMIFLLLGLMYSTAYAEEMVTELTVTEQNGVAVESYLISRGIPLKEGYLGADEELIVKDENNQEISTQCKILTRYDDDSIKWMQIAFLVDLQANENRKFFVYKTDKRQKENITVLNENGVITANTGKISISIDNQGIQKLIVNGYNVFKEEGTLSVYEGKIGTLYTANGGTVELVEHGPVYAQILVKTPYNGGVMRCEQIYTICKNSDKVSCDYRWVSYDGRKAGKDTVSSLYEQYNLQDGFDTIVYKSKEISNSSESNPIYSCDWIEVYNQEQNIKFAIVSKDVEKLRKFSGSICNGFTNKGNEIIFAPVLYGNEYSWVDGAGRTVHADILVKTASTIEKDDVLLTQKNTPAVIINPEVYKNAGLIESSKISSAALCQVNTAVWMKGRSNGYYRAGYIPQNIDIKANTFAGTDVPLGETGFNLWYAQMTSGNPDLFDVLVEHEKEYIDNAIYEGAVVEARGGGRYRIGKTAQENSTHPFYSEFSHLYMTYCMTGEEHYKRAMAEMADYIYRNAMATNFSGYNIATVGMWENGTFTIRSMAEIRYSFMIRAMYYAYELFEDEKYLYVGNEIAKWVRDTQEQNGSWSQAYNTDGSNYYYTSMSQVLYKNYIMLYGLRGPAEYYRRTEIDVLRQPLINFADYLLSEMQNEQWLWDPVADKTITETSEDYSRGKAPMQEIMATEILELVYDITGEEKYFEGMCKFLRYFLGCVQDYGTAPQRYNYKGYVNGLASSPIFAMNTTLSRIDNKLIAVFEENRELAIKLGFEDLVDIFADGAIHSPNKISGDFHYIDVTAHIYENDKNKWLYVANQSGYYSENIWEKTIDVKTRTDGFIWSNCENIIDNIYEVKASKYYEIFEMSTMKLLPIKVSGFNDTVKIKAEQYNSDGISLSVTGSSGNSTIEIYDGDFSIVDGGKYYVSIKKSGNKQDISIKANDNGNYMASDGKLLINLIFSNNNISYEDIQNHWAKNDIEAITAKGFLHGVGGNLFAPEKTVTKYEFVLMAMRILGYQNDEEAISKALELEIIQSDDSLNEFIKRDEMTDISIKVLEQCRDLNDLPIEVESYKIKGEIQDDDEAVNADAESITLEDYSPTKSNLALPYEGMYGSSIRWESSDTSVINNEGIIHKPLPGQEKTITLTAYFKRNNAETSKTFELFVPDNTNISYQAHHPIGNAIIPVRKTDANFDFTFDAIPYGKGIDCVFGFMDSSESYSVFTDVPMLIRFNTDGVIDAYNKNGYAKINVVKYVPGEIYTFRVYGTIGTKTYGVTVKDSSGNEFVIADNFEFRATAQDIKCIDLICVDEPDEEAEVIRHDLALNTPLEGGGLMDAINYFKFETGDLNLSASDLISSMPDIVDNSGKIVSTPNRTTVVDFFRMPPELTPFKDFDEIENIYKLSVLKGQMIALVYGSEGYFEPSDTSTRAEAATLVRRIYDLKEAGKIF